MTSVVDAPEVGDGGTLVATPAAGVDTTEGTDIVVRATRSEPPTDGWAWAMPPIAATPTKPVSATIAASRTTRNKRLPWDLPALSVRLPCTLGDIDRNGRYPE